MNRNEELTAVSKPKKHRAGRIVTSVILCVILVVGSAAAYIYREEIATVAKFVSNNISAAFYALTTPEEDVQEHKEQNDKKTQELLEEIAVATMRDLTDEERAMLASGELSYEDALALIRGETVVPRETAEVPEPVETTAAPDVTVTTVSEPIVTSEPVEPAVATAATTAVTTAATTVATTVPETDEVLDTAALMARQEEIIAEIYLLRAEYLNEIDKLIEDGKAEYNALPKEKHTLKYKLEISERMLEDGNKLEDECDARMDALLDELEDILKKLSASTDIIDEIYATYREQKKLKKTELYNEYSPKLK